MAAPNTTSTRSADGAVFTEHRQTPEDGFHVHGREFYWLRNGGMADAKITGAILERAVGGPATQRNITTIRRLAAKYA